MVLSSRHVRLVESDAFIVVAASKAQGPNLSREVTGSPSEELKQKIWKTNCQPCVGMARVG